MKEIYFLQRIGNIGDAFDVICILSLILGIILLFSVLIWWFIMMDEYDRNEFKIIPIKIKKLSKAYIVVFAISIIGTIFIPSSKEVMLMYGLGGTIDYIKSNDKAKELPNKVVDALTEYIETTKKKN